MIDYNFFLHDAVPILRCNGTDDHADAVEWAVAEIERLREANRVLVEAAKPIIARIDDLPSIAQLRAENCTVELEHIRALARSVPGGNT